MGYFDALLKFFNFTRETDLVVAACIVLLLGSVIGGMMSSLFKAFGGPLKPIMFKDTAGFRVLILLEIALIAVVFYYHFHAIGKLEPIQVIFWITTGLSMPVSWFIGGQLTQLIFWSKISKNKKAYRDIVAKRRYEKHKKMREKINEDTKVSAEARKQKASLTAKGRRGMEQLKKRGV